MVDLSFLEGQEGEWPRKYCLLFWEVETKSVRASFEGYSSDVVIAEDGKQMAFHRRIESRLTELNVGDWMAVFRMPVLFRHMMVC